MGKGLQKLYNKSSRILELEHIKKRIDKSTSEDIRVKIQTKHWFGYTEPFISIENHKIYIQKETMSKIINEMIKQERANLNNYVKERYNENNKKRY